jgi:hypothetical protein
MIAGQRIGTVAAAEPPQAQHLLSKQVSARLPRGAPRCRHSASSSFAKNRASSPGRRAWQRTPVGGIAGRIAHH